MLKKKWIPTPLVVHKAHRSDVPKPVRLRVLFIFGLVLRVLWFVWMMKRRPGGRYTPASLAIMVTERVERLGGLWVKAAQIIAMRRDLFSKEFCDELSRLHDRAHGFPGEVARGIIERDLGRPIDEVFRKFETDPIAAASIGQVHVAWLRESGQKVAVKVQRPTIAETFRKDMAILNGYFSLLRLFRVMSWARFDEMFETLQQTLADELDYRIEVASMRRMRRLLKIEKSIVPKVHPRFCTKRVLTMDILDGVLMSDYIQVCVSDPARAKAWAKENDINPKKFGRNLFLSMLKQLLEDNVIHGDLHPGNIMMLKKNRVAYIDFGSIAVLDAAFMLKYNVSIRALWRKDFSKYAEGFLLLAPSIPTDTDIAEVKKKVVRVVENWEAMTGTKGVPYEVRSLTGLLAGISAIIGKYKFPPDWSMLRLLRTMTALDATFRFVIPEVDFYKVMERFYTKQRGRMLKHAASKRSRADVAMAIGDALKIPGVLGENMMFQGDLIRKRAMSFQADISKAARVGMALVGTIVNIGLIATVFIVAKYLTRAHDVGRSAIAQLPVRDVFGSMPTLTPGMWIVVIILSLYLLRSLRKLAQVLGVTSPGTNPFLGGGG